jgi:thioredoxin-related protein
MLISFGFSLLLALASIVAFAEDAVDAVHLEVSDHEEALALARGEDRRVYLIFKGDSCHWCERQSVEMKSPAYARAMDGMVVCVIDIVERRDLADRYRVSSVPSHRFLDSEGRVLKSSTGFMDSVKAGRFLAP